MPPKPKNAKSSGAPTLVGKTSATTKTTAESARAAVEAAASATLHESTDSGSESDVINQPADTINTTDVHNTDVHNTEVNTATSDNSNSDTAATALAHAVNNPSRFNNNNNNDNTNVNVSNVRPRRLARVPAAVRRKLSVFDVDALDYYTNMSATIPSGQYAIRARSAFSSFRACWKAERGYVRKLMPHCREIAFVRQPGYYPLLLIDLLSEPVADGGVGGLSDVLRRVTEFRGISKDDVVADGDSVGNAQLPDLTIADVVDVDTAAERTAHVLLGLGSELQTIQANLSTTLAADSATSVRGARWFPFSGASNPAVRDEVLALKFTFKKRSYIDGLETATANLTPSEAERIRDNDDAMVIPLTHIDDYDAKREHTQLTLRWKNRVEVSTWLTAAIALQKKYKAFAYAITYGNLRLTAPAALSQDVVVQMRTDLGDGAIVIPDVPLNRALAWQGTTIKRTIFVPGSATPTNGREVVVSPTAAIRRLLVVSGAVSLRQLGAIATHIKADVISAHDTPFIMADMAFVVEFSNGEAESLRNLEQNGLAVQLGSRLISVAIRDV